MLVGKTILEFEHTPGSAVEAGLSAVALAITWSEEGSDHQEDLEQVQRTLRALRKRMSKGATIRQTPSGF